MALTKLRLNGRDHALDVDPRTPLLWVLREQLGMDGTRFGCGRGLCGACTVHLDGKAVRSCSWPVGEVGAREITTIEGLPATTPLPAAGGDVGAKDAGATLPVEVPAPSGDSAPARGIPASGLHPVQEAWLEGNVPQCGYCQSGQLMTAAALLSKTPSPSGAEIDAAMSGNICRCGTYPRIRAAVRRAAASLAELAPAPEAGVSSGAEAATPEAAASDAEGRVQP